MKRLLFPLFIITVPLVGDTSSHAISATTSLPLAASPPGNITTHAVVQTGEEVMRAPQQARTLSFAERVAYQRAIEEVYWRHRIWPKESACSKPLLDAVMTQRQLEKKVEDYLRDSQALQGYWQQPITAEQLQAEMDRMAQRTKQPKVLREIFEALGNNPFVIAECLARPALAERLLTTLYAHDQRFHGELKRRAQAELLTHRDVKQMKQTSGMYTEMELVRSGSGKDEENRSAQTGSRMNSSEWNGNVHKLAAIFDKGGATTASALAARRHVATVESTDISTRSKDAADDDYQALPLGKLSSLQEDEDHYFATAIVKKSNDRVKLATVAWLKEPLKSWLARAEKQIPVTMAAAMRIEYALPAIAEPSTTCTDDTWATTATDVPTARFGHTAVWTGSEMIVWGGCDNVVCYSNTGGRYDAATDNWRGTSTTSAPDGRVSHTAVWTGDEMIVWGGFSGSNVLNTGGRYNPGTDSWIATSTTHAPSARNSQTAVWTGSEMIVWGGLDNSFNDLNTGGKYNPSTDSWTATTTINAPSARYLHTAVWTGSEMIIWGGGTNTGGRYNPSTNSWIATSINNAPAARYDHTAVWTGSQMIVWGGCNGSLPCANPFNTGGRYNPSTDSWTATSINNAPSARGSQTAVWTGNEMIVWGGFNDAFLNTGGKYNPSTDNWAPTSTTNAPPGRESHTAVWTGDEMIVWGGSDQGGYLNTGGRYNPTTNSWTATETLSDTPGYTAVWTGSEMIVWGGTVTGVGVSNTGARYNPSTDSWTTTSTTNAPSGRENHTAVWTGDEMIIWGGFNGDNDLNTGGRYNPISDSWIAISITNAPSARANHTAVWTGSQMIVWGGLRGNSNLNTGGRYSPITDSWTATTTTNAPSGRHSHTTVWTGSEMIVWGGFGGSNFVNTGGRYNPGTNSWTATSTTNAPSGRGSHTAVWTGSEMIVWGGFGNSDLNSGGRYNPGADSWTPTSTTNAPSGRGNHTAVWTGNKMIVWGGEYDDTYFVYPLNTGGRYNPISDSWTATSTTNAPSARTDHTAVWTGSEMIIWGGIDPYSDNTFNTGGRYCVPMPPAQLANISTRAFVQTGDNVMIGGFIVQGTEPKRVIIRAIGPELGAPPYNVPNALANPTLELHNGTGALIASNNNWATTIIGGIITASQVRDIQASGHAPGDARESAIIADLPAGNYTAIVRGVNDTTGVALVEVYDLSAESNSILANISTRSFVQTGDKVMIGGFIVEGTASKRVIVRAIGPELTQYGVPDALANPTLELHDSLGTLIASNGNWRQTIIGGIIHNDQVRDIMASGLAPGDGRESAIIADLPAGNYTAIVRGVNNTTGVGLVEVYDLQ